jgi:transcriptional regulator NrdR family protein
MIDVIKKSGKREMFNPDKVTRSVNKAIIDAGMLTEDKKAITQQVVEEATRLAEGKTTVASSALRENILNGLEKADPTVAQAWRKFDQRYKSSQMRASGAGAKRKRM